MSSPNSKRQKVVEKAAGSSSSGNNFLGEIECSICLCFFANAHSIVPCGDTFCYSCLYDLCISGPNKNSANKLNCSAQCPMCRSSFTLNSLMPNRKLDNVVEKVLIDSKNSNDLKEWQKKCDDAAATKRKLTNPPTSSKSSSSSKRSSSTAPTPRTSAGPRYTTGVVRTLPTPHPHQQPPPLQRGAPRFGPDFMSHLFESIEGYPSGMYNDLYDDNHLADILHEDMLQSLEAGIMGSMYNPVVARPPVLGRAPAAASAAVRARAAFVETAPRAPPTTVDLTERAPLQATESHTVVYAQRGNRDCDHCKKKIDKGDCKMVTERQVAPVGEGTAPITVSNSYHLSCLALLQPSPAQPLAVTTDQVQGYAALKQEDKVALIDALLVHNTR